MKNFEPSPELHGDPPVAATSQALVDRKELASTALERTRMPMVMADARHPDRPIVLANTAFLDLTGYSAEEVLGRNCRFLQGKGTSEAAIARIRAGLDQDREINVEILNYRKDGKAFWNQLHISPIYDDSGELQYYFASQMDVTELRKVQSLEASEHRLLMEVDHRSKNVLAVVNSIVRLSDSRDPNLYAASVQQRVQALAIAHGMLAENGWRAVKLQNLIEGQAAPFARHRIDIDGPGFMIQATDVQSFALVFHELIVNASVHGALKPNAGRVSVMWEAGPTRDLQLIWAERNSQTAVRPQHRGFGNAMIDAMIEKQLGGTIKRDWTDAGLEVRISLPGAL